MIENVEISTGIIEQYVLGLCSPEDQLVIDLSRQTNLDLDKAILEFELQLEQEMMRGGLLPSKETDSIILSRLSTLNLSSANQSTANSSSEVEPQTGVNRQIIIRTIRYFAVAASVILVVGASYNLIIFSKYKHQQADLISRKLNAISSLPVGDYSILKDPNITTIAMNGVGVHMICRCTMFWDKKTGKVYIMIHHLPLSDNTKDYQLWANVNGKPVSVGIIDDSIRGRFIQLANMPIAASSFSVTLEKAGGASLPTEKGTYLRGKI